MEISKASTYDVIVIGAGHAGIEAGLACARMGCRTLMLTMREDTVGHMSCNPAIGGVGKGQLVREIDALGGEMARAADACGIQFRILNASKGPAVQSSRAQIDRDLYKAYMRKTVLGQKGLSLMQAQAASLIIEGGVLKGIRTTDGREILCRSLVVASGTFLGGLIHVGLRHYPGGRTGEEAAASLAADMARAGLVLLRFKTGTCPRLDKDSIDYSRLKVQEGDDPPRPFSFSTQRIRQTQVPCHITYTNQRTHQVITDNLDKSPLYTGIIKATGVRYCPSIEDKLVKFPDRQRHQIFLEPEGYTSRQVYPNGLSTSLPEEVQEQMVHSVEGLEEARILEYGYGIEHTVVEPTQLFPTLESKPVRGLFFAGQVNGTTGYEEAACQGLMAGINAALKAQGREAFVLDRASSYIGVLIDDLTTKGTPEPYRMFTSRVEYRLLIREDNADLRLSGCGRSLGLLSEKDTERLQEKQRLLQEGMKTLRATYIKPGAGSDGVMASLGLPALRRKTSLEELLKRPQVNASMLSRFPGVSLGVPSEALVQAEIEVKYAGFIERQLAEVEKFRNLEKIRLPQDLDLASVPGLSREIREKLSRFKPLNLGQAARISGVTPAAVSILMVFLHKRDHGKR
ncbi:MAG: tRNA uridine-5-carboxymethylaminomethyl(34) synthesis enzyme MnmG [Deltaproteobacteria bacterium]